MATMTTAAPALAVEQPKAVPVAPFLALVSPHIGVGRRRSDRDLDRVSAFGVVAGRLGRAGHLAALDSAS